MDGTAFGEGDLPHLGLAHQYLNHYRCRSEQEDLLSRAVQLSVQEWLVLHERGVIDAAELRQQLGLAGCAPGNWQQADRSLERRRGILR